MKSREFSSRLFFYPRSESFLFIQCCAIFHFGQLIPPIPLPAGRPVKKTTDTSSVHYSIPFLGRTSARVALLICLVLLPFAVMDYMDIQDRREQNIDFTLDELARINNSMTIHFRGLMDSARDVLMALSQVEEVRSGTSEACSETMKRVAAQYARYTLFAKVNNNGMMTCSSQLPLPFTDYSKSPLFQRAITSKSFSISEFSIGVVTGKPIMIMLNPIIDTTNDVTGVVSLGLNLDWVQDFILSLTPPPGMEVLIFSDKGTVLAVYPPDSYPIGAPLETGDILPLVLDKQHGTGSCTGPGGERILVAFSKVPSLPGNVYIAGYRPESQVLDKLDKTMRERMILHLLVLALSLSLAFLAAQRLLLRWTTGLTVQARRLAAGNLSARSGLPHNDSDLGQLAGSMDAMARELQTRESRLRESETRYRSLVENFPGGSIVLMDRDFRFVLAGGSGFGHFDIPLDKLQGMSAYDLLARKTIDTMEPLYHAALSGKTVDSEVEFENRVYLIRVTPVHVEGSPINQFISIALDITQRKEAEEALRMAQEELEERVRQRTRDLQEANLALQNENLERIRMERSLRESESRFRSIVERTPVGLCITNSEGVFEYVNPAYCQIYDYAPEQLLGRFFTMVVTPEFQEELASIHSDFLKGERDPRGEWEGITSSGERIIILADVVRIQGSDGMPKIVIFVLDITQRKKNEEALLAAKVQAEGANRSKSEFLATMSHELRTPLNAIIGLSDLLTGCDLDEEAKDYAQSIKDAATDLHGVFSEILEFARLDAQTTSLAMGAFEVRFVCEELIRSQRPEAEFKGLRLRLSLDDNVPRVLIADVQKIRRVLLSLLENAVKYTSRGEVELFVKCGIPPSRPDVLHSPELVDTYESVLECTVRDTGIGIAPEQQERIFQSFTQVEDPFTRAHGGVGLGLAIARRLTELLGGELTVESQPGSGSTFSFSCPVRQMVL